ncbi:hypothetical protein [Kingella sp. (in: b-proteobacteria)]|nr:hypothetical protein [Kingella sp. (in: b-proteobacteria)]
MRRMPLSYWARILTLAYIGFNDFYSWDFRLPILFSGCLIHRHPRR